MPRRPLLRSDRFPYHVWSRSNNKDWFYLSSENCWEIFCRNLARSCFKYEAHVYAFVLMSNHFHLMLSTPQSNIAEFMGHFLTNVSRAIQQEAKRINHVFGSRYRWTLLDSSWAVGYVLKYIFRNPVRAGITNTVESYPYSSLVTRRRVGQADGIGPLWKFVPKELPARLEWLNQPTAKELESLITQGLRRETFAFSKDNTKQKLIRDLRGSYGIDGQEDDRYFSSLEGD